jgi:ATP/ADP translocase
MGPIVLFGIAFLGVGWYAFGEAIARGEWIVVAIVGPLVGMVTGAALAIATALLVKYLERRGADRAKGKG